MEREEAINLVKQVLPCLNIDEKIREGFETLIPELAESEDERMLRTIIRGFENWKGNGNVTFNNTKVDDILAYLEKQKDSASNNFEDVWNEEDCEEIIAEGQKLTPRFKEFLKEVCHAWYDRGAKLEKQKETGIRWFKSDNVKNPDKPYIDKVGMFYTTDGRMCYASEIEKQKRETLRDFVDDFPYRVEQKEQKPTKKHDLVAQLREHLANTPKEQLEAEWKELEEWNHVGPTVEEYLGRIKSAEWTLPKDFEEAVYKVANFISPFDNQEELRKVSHHFAEQLLSLAKKELDEPAEWGKPTINGEPIPTENQSIDIPLAEWSEEDEETLACAISVFEDFAECKNVSVPPASAKRYLKRLKSLRPQPKQEWSEEDDDFINMLILHFNYLINKGGDSVETYKSYIEKLKSLRPSWKPSEHQMNILKAVKEYVGRGSGYWGEGLGSLIEDLEKL